MAFLRLGAVVVALAIFAAGAAPTALGHGGLGLRVDPPVAESGAEIVVYGDYLWTDQQVSIVLLAIDGTMWTLGQATTDGNGSVNARVTLPAGLPDATYSILARAPSGEDAHVRLIVRAAGPVPPVALVVVAVLAVVLVIAFTAAVVMRRRRRIDPDI